MRLTLEIDGVEVVRNYEVDTVDSKDWNAVMRDIVDSIKDIKNI